MRISTTSWVRRQLSIEHEAALERLAWEKDARLGLIGAGGGTWVADATGRVDDPATQPRPHVRRTSRVSPYEAGRLALEGL